MDVFVDGVFKMMSSTSSEELNFIECYTHIISKSNKSKTSNKKCQAVQQGPVPVMSYNHDNLPRRCFLTISEIVKNVESMMPATVNVPPTTAQICKQYEVLGLNKKLMPFSHFSNALLLKLA